MMQRSAETLFNRIKHTLEYGRALASTVIYQLLPLTVQKRIQSRRIRDLIEYARDNSRYYAENIPKNISCFEEIPPTTKKVLMEKFDDVITDNSIKIENILPYIYNHENPELCGGKYSLSLTSGSTGRPALIIKDEASEERESVVSAFRDLHMRFPIATISDVTSLGIETSLIQKNIKCFPWLKGLMVMLGAKEEPKELMRKIIEKRPYNLVGYTSLIRLVASELIREKKEGPLRQVFCSGELVTESDFALLHKAFPKAKIREMYGSSEGGVMASSCKYGHLHINTDMVRLEAVDQDFNPVPDGTLSDYTLLTHLFNHVQPLIRYVLDDRIEIHHEKCPCGCRSPWIYVEGRTDDILVFEGESEKIKISPMSIIDVMDEISEGCLINYNNYQIVLRPGNALEIRLDYYDNSSHESVFREVESALSEYLNQRGVQNVKCVESDIRPQRTTSRGKHKRIYQES